MSKIWTTKDGTEIPIRNLEDSHLLNIAKLIKKKAKNGITVMHGGGGWDIDDMWYYEEELKGKEVEYYFDYESIIREIKRRKLK